MNEQPLVLKRYRLVERIAVGGSAEVWRAQDEQLDRPVAVKRLHPHLLPDAASRQRLVAEARAVARLSQPVIVGIYDVDSTGESPAIVMELVDGESLAARIDRDGALSERKAATITADLAEALYHAHQQGVVHRDVKPGNVLLSADGRTRLVDFGIAHSLAASTERLTVTGTVVGTLRSMAPEQLSGGPITPRTDLYGLGVVLHEALTGRPPYAATSPVALAEAQRAGPPAMPGVDPALAAVVAGCLAHDPAERPLHAGALASALRSWLAGDPSAAALLAPAAFGMPTLADTGAMTQVVSATPAAGAPPSAAAAPILAAGPASPSAASADAARMHRRSRAWPVGALIGVAAIGLAVAVVLANARPSGVNDSSPTASASASAEAPAVQVTPGPSQEPGWLPNLVERLAEECNDDVAQAEAPVLAQMSRQEAADRVEQLSGECRGGDGDGDD
jgi:serine/threonine-protein kinase